MRSPPGRWRPPARGRRGQRGPGTPAPSAAGPGPRQSSPAGTPSPSAAGRRGVRGTGGVGVRVCRERCKCTCRHAAARERCDPATGSGCKAASPSLQATAPAALLRGSRARRRGAGPAQTPAAGSRTRAPRCGRRQTPPPARGAVRRFGAEVSTCGGNPGAARLASLASIRSSIQLPQQAAANRPTWPPSCCPAPAGPTCSILTAFMKRRSDTYTGGSHLSCGPGGG